MKALTVTILFIFYISILFTAPIFWVYGKTDFPVYILIAAALSCISLIMIKRMPLSEKSSPTPSDSFYDEHDEMLHAASQAATRAILKSAEKNQNRRDFKESIESVVAGKHTVDEAVEEILYKLDNPF